MTATNKIADGRIILRLFMFVLITIFACEMGVMFILPHILPEKPDLLLEAMADASFLSVFASLFIAPALIWFLRRAQTAEQLLVTAREKAEASSRSKSAFLANMSHEIRTPMNGIIGLTDVLSHSKITTEQRRHLDLVRSSADALMTVLNDILDFSKIEAGKMVIDPTQFSMGDVIGNALKLFSPKADEKKIELAYRLVPGTPNHVIADAGRIRQVLVNLVGNALKFTSHGEVAVSVECVGRSKDQVELLFSVRDTGIGIPQDRQSQIFESFTQADESTTRKYGGTGLGLSISSRLVELMHGRLWLTSEPGVGSTFFFQIPCGVATTQEAPKTKAPMEKLPKLRVLVVDDNSTNRLILKEMLTMWQAEVTLLDHGAKVREALEIGHAEGHPYNLVLLDYNMPDMDGCEVANIIRRTPCAKDIIILLLSSTHIDSLQSEFANPLYNAHLCKPVSQSDLLEAIQEQCAIKMGAPIHVACGGPSTNPVSSEETKEKTLYRILLAEDSPVNQHLMIHVLTQSGHTVLLAKDGREAVELLERERVDIVLMDCQMPILDGYQATRRIRFDNHISRSTNKLPIIALTANAMTGDREKCLEAGMDDYVAKPVHFPELYEKMAKLIVPYTPPAAAAKESVAAEKPVVDKNELWTRIGGDHDLLGILVDAFREDGSQNLTELKSAFQNSDFETARKLAHTIKGTAANLACVRLAMSAKTLEKHCMESDLPAAQAQLSQLEHLMQETLNSLVQVLNEPALEKVS